MCYGNVEIARSRRGNDDGPIRRSDLPVGFGKASGSGGGRADRPCLPRKCDAQKYPVVSPPVMYDRKTFGGSRTYQSHARDARASTVAASNAGGQNDIYRVFLIRRRRKVCEYRRDGGGFMNIFDVCLPNNRRI